MVTIDVKNSYEARVKIEDCVISSTRGDSVEQLKVFLSQQCDLEQSGAEGEIIECATGKIVYKCHKQTVIDE